ncbi:soluble quino protein glucose dehydrogenase [Hortaea werneckii]|nr:soluble quino protein glucose dehydrogenase [Hortaea werneckii]
MSLFFVATALFSALASSQYLEVGGARCGSTFTTDHPAPQVADGYVARLVADSLTSPRGIKFDSAGNLLVVEQESGITALTFNVTDGDCITETSMTSVINDTSLNHGIELSQDGRTLYASNPEAVYSWDYDPEGRRNTSAPRTLITNMTNSDHTTRTLLLSRKADGVMVVTRGSTSNIDALASDLSTGHSQVKAFNISSLGSSLSSNSTGAGGANGSSPYNFNTDGVLLGWGLRNEVGIDEEPNTGRIYGVENSVDEMTREGEDIHTDNPGEELNFLGYLSNNHNSSNQGRNFGYPECYAAWDVSAIPDFEGQVGEQFAIGDLNSTVNDTTCNAANRQAPRLVFQAHMAPLDILFNAAGTAAWITFHGSWDREDPVGYKLSVVEFDADTGEPVANSTSKTAARDVVWNEDNSACPGQCFRPVGLAWDAEGRLFMSSDATGEIYAITRTDGNSTGSVGGGGNGTATVPDSDGEGSSASGSSSGGGGSGSSQGSSDGSSGGGSESLATEGSMSALAVIFAALAFFL